MSLIQRSAVQRALRHVIDPEVGLNVVDLGLIYDVQVDDADGVQITMTLTTQNCPMGDVLTKACRQTVIDETMAPSVEIDLVWEPAWSPERISPAGKLQLSH